MVLAITNLLQAPVESLTTNDYLVLVAIQLVILALFIFTIKYFCSLLKRKEPEKSIKKTCILISFLSAIAWFIIAQIVWVITTLQYSGG